jgi:hypothetical protein
MKLFKLAGLLGLMVVFFITGTTFAQGGGQGKGAQGTAPKYGCQQRFDELDANKDGKITKEEFFAIPHHMANAEQNFKAMDVNGDGSLTKEEFCASKGRGRGQDGGGNQ